MSGDSNTREAHWKAVYQQKSSTSASWYRPHLETSLTLLKEAGVGPRSHVIDVGGGASTLVDDLLALGVEKISVLDLSDEAMVVSQQRLGQRSDLVNWIEGDVTSIRLPAGEFTHWHDRAVLHFLHNPEDLSAYAQHAAEAVVSGGFAVIGGFAPDGPERCSGLSVARRSSTDVAEILAPSFRLISSSSETHQTPGGAVQSFAYALLRRT